MKNTIHIGKVLIQLYRMPGYKAHLKIGMWTSIVFTIIFGAFLFMSYPSNMWILFLAPLVIFVYSQIPDVDTYLSKIRKYLFKTIFAILTISTILFAFIDLAYIILLLTLTGVVGLAVFKLKHRGATHSYLFIFLIALPLFFVHWFLFAVAFVSGFSHIFVDRFWSRFKRRVKKKLNIRTTTNVYVRI